MQWPDILQPVHIVLLQLLIDPACAIVFEAEAAAPNIMNRPPRVVSASPFSVKNVGYALLQGVGIALILLIGYALLRHSGWNEANILISLFTALIPILFLLVLANRGATFMSKRNPWILTMFGGVRLILASVLLVPFLRDMLRFTPITLTQAFIALVLLSAGGIWLKLLQNIHKKLPLS